MSWLPARSAEVRATFKIRSYARAESCSFSIAVFRSIVPALLITQTSRTILLGIWALRAWYGRFVDEATRVLPFDERNFVLVVSIAVAAGLIAGVYPAWRIGRAAPASYLKVQ